MVNAARKQGSSNFAVACSLLSQFIKEKGSAADLGLGISQVAPKGETAMILIVPLFDVDSTLFDRFSWQILIISLLIGAGSQRFCRMLENLLLLMSLLSYLVFLVVSFKLLCSFVDHCIGFLR